MSEDHRYPTCDPDRVWKLHERCRVTFEGRTADALVIVASPGGRSLMLQFFGLLGDGRLGVYVGQMPLLWYSREREFRDLIMWRPAKLEPLPEGNADVEERPKTQGQ